MFLNFVVIVCALSNPDICVERKYPMWSEVQNMNQCLSLGPVLSVTLLESLTKGQTLKSWECEKTTVPLDFSSYSVDIPKKSTK
jgi:hypothetical protein